MGISLTGDDATNSTLSCRGIAYTREGAQPPPSGPKQTDINPLETDIANARHSVTQADTELPVLWVI
jgi:hypothetical protein